MKVAIMQPYFFPYVGYFQLIKSVDLFIVYDNIKFTKKGWINRNRILQNGTDVMFSLALKKDSDFLDVRERELSADFDRATLLNKIRGAYQKAPYYKQVFPLIEQVVQFEEQNLFKYIHNSILRTCEYLGITTEIRISSEIDIDHDLKNQDKVVAMCDAVGASTYLNPVGGIELYSKEIFGKQGIDLRFIQSDNVVYEQYGNEFVPWLSIIDVMMFNSREALISLISSNYELV